MIGMVAGLLLIIGRKGMAKSSMRSHEKLLGIYVEETRLRYYEWGCVAAGLLMVVFGVLQILQGDGGR